MGGSGPELSIDDRRSTAPDTVPLLRFSTGYELWRVTSLCRMLSWRDEIAPDEPSSARGSFCAELSFALSEADVDRGIFVLVRDGFPVRFLFLELNSSLREDRLLACLKRALPGHPKEDPDAVLQAFRWFVERLFDEVGPNLWPSSRWYALAPPTGSLEVEVLVGGDEEVRALLHLPSPYSLPLGQFLDWVSSCERGTSSGESRVFSL